jgi:hypothetical protein
MFSLNNLLIFLRLMVKVLCIKDEPQLLKNIKEPIIYLKNRNVASFELIEKEMKKEKKNTRLLS